MKPQKVAERIFRGIHYIQLNDLPKEQSQKLREWIPEDQVIKLMINKEIIPECVQYHHYEHWFDNIYPKHLVAEEEKKNQTNTAKSAISNFLKPSY